MWDWSSALSSGACRRGLYTCYLRQYRGLRSAGFSVTDKWVGYLPFQLSMTFKETQADSALKIYLVITAVPIHSAYICKPSSYLLVYNPTVQGLLTTDRETTQCLRAKPK